MEHDRAYHRFKDKVKQKRKLGIIRRTWWGPLEWFMEDKKAVGQLVKGKPYCSCPMCNGANKRKVAGPKISEIRKMKEEE